MTTIIEQLRTAQAAGDAIAYYYILEQNGDLYGKLAKGVVMSDAMAGTIARAYAGSVAASAGVALGGGAWAEISLGLMALDLVARENHLVDSGTPLNLPYAVIQAYHNEVFDDHGLPHDAWTANIPLNQAGNPEATWQSMLQFPDDWFWGMISGTGTLISESDSLLVLARLSLPIPITTIPSYGQVSEELFWAYHTVEAFMHYVRDQYGGASMGSVEPFAINLPSGGLFIGGSDQVDDVLAGTGGDDVIIGFRGDDILGGLNGNDRIYGGEGDDIIHAGPDGGDLFYGGVNGEEGDTVHFNESWGAYAIAAIDGGFSITLRDGQQTETLVFEIENFNFDGQLLDATAILNSAPTEVEIESIGANGPGRGLARGTYAAGAVVADLQAIDANEFDQFTWELVGPGADFYTIDANGVVRTKASVTYDYALWRQQVGNTTFEQWQVGDLGAGFAALLGTQYGFTVKVTDINGASKEKDIYLFLEDGQDTTFGTPLNDTLVGGLGRTVIAGFAGADDISDPDWFVLDYSASDAGVRIQQVSTSDRFFRGYGGHAEGDVIRLGWPTYRYDIIGSEYGDKIFYAHHVVAGGGDDEITGSKIVYAGDGYDIVTVTRETDFIDFGTGGGELRLARFMHGYIIDMELGLYQMLSGSGNGTIGHTLTVVGDFDKLTGSNYNDVIYGTEGADQIDGGGGTSEALYGRGGDDHLTGRGIIRGGEGSDTIVLLGGFAYGDEGNDTLRTSQTGSQLFGGSGNDTLTSTTYGVVLVGGLGADTFIGSSSANSPNTISYRDASGGVGVTHNGSIGFGWSGEANGDVLQGNFSFIGSSHGDDFNITLRPGYGAFLWGGGGDDVIYASKGNYTEIHGDGVEGSTGSDNDTIITTGLGGKVFGGRGNDTIVGAGELHGGTGEDTITVNAEGPHRIYFGVDADMDIFVFTGIGNVSIRDFTSEDRILVTTEHTFSEIMEDAEQEGAHVSLWFGDAAKVSIMNFNLGSLSSEHFLFA